MVEQFISPPIFFFVSSIIALLKANRKPFLGLYTSTKALAVLDLPDPATELTATIRPSLLDNKVSMTHCCSLVSSICLPSFAI